MTRRFRLSMAVRSYCEAVAIAIVWTALSMAVADLFRGAYWLATGSMIGLDATDSPTERSGLAIKIDHGTSCQYLVTSLGGATPRLKAGGRPMCGDAP